MLYIILIAAIVVLAALVCIMYVRTSIIMSRLENMIDRAIDNTFSESSFNEKKLSKLEALSNIVDNAIKYTSHGGLVTVSTREYKMFVCIDVADSGIGMTEEETAKIFTVFLPKTPGRVDGNDKIQEAIRREQ